MKPISKSDSRWDYWRAESHSLKQGKDQRNMAYVKKQMRRSIRRFVNNPRNWE